MEWLKRASIILELLDGLKKHGSWGGETHIQKAMYFLQSLKDVPMGFNFILYKHGPFSFDLRDELTALRAYGLLDLCVQSYPYGASYCVSDSGETIKLRFPKTLKKYKPEIKFVAEQLGDKGVVDLERLATALYVIQNYDIDDVNALADKMVSLKPHVAAEQAHDAILRMRKMVKVA